MTHNAASIALSRTLCTKHTAHKPRAAARERARDARQARSNTAERARAQPAPLRARSAPREQSREARSDGRATTPPVARARRSFAHTCTYGVFKHRRCPARDKGIAGARRHPPPPADRPCGRRGRASHIAPLTHCVGGFAHDLSGGIPRREVQPRRRGDSRASSHRRSVGPLAREACVRGDWCGALPLCPPAWETTWWGFGPFVQLRGGRVLNHS